MASFFFYHRIRLSANVKAEVDNLGVSAPLVLVAKLSCEARLVLWDNPQT